MNPYIPIYFKAETETKFLEDLFMVRHSINCGVHIFFSQLHVQVATHLNATDLAAELDKRTVVLLNSTWAKLEQ